MPANAEYTERRTIIIMSCGDLCLGLLAVLFPPIAGLSTPIFACCVPARSAMGLRN